MYLAIIIICIIFSSFFSATETAFSSLSRITLTNMAKNQKKAAKTLKLYEKYDNLITTILIGNNIVNILSASLASLLCVAWFGEETGPAISTIAMTIIVLIFGEITPKVIAKQYPEKFAIAVTPFINLLILLFAPLSGLFTLWTKLIKGLFKNIVTDDNNVEIEDEIFTMVEEAASNGEIDDEKKDLIQNAIAFYEATVEDAYCPRVDVVAIERNMSIEAIKQVFEDSSYSRLPVYEGDLDSVVGFINYKDFDPALENIDSIIQEIVCVTKNQKISDVLKEFQESQIHISVVVGEYGEFLGIITLEDIMEELVGEIYDESDDIEEIYEKINDDEYNIIGNADLSFIEDLLDIEIDAKAHTLNGWLIDKLKRLPRHNDIITHADWIFTVEAVDDKMISKVVIKKSQEKIGC